MTDRVVQLELHMLKLFENKNFHTESSTIPFQLRESRTQAFVILENVMKYWERSSFRPDNTHLLVQILRALDHSLETPLLNVLANVDARDEAISKHFQLVSGGNYGKPHKKVFYGSQFNDVTEYVVSLELADIDPFDTENKWKHISPFKVLYHPANDFRWLLPCGQTYSGLKGFSVVGVDVKLLAMQFNLFKKEQYDIHREKAILSPQAFLITDALPKIYPSHIDQAVWNCGVAEMNMEELFIPREWLPLATPDLSLNVKKMVKNSVPRIADTRRYYVQTLESLPALFYDNAHEFLKLPHIPYTKQSNWIRILSRWKHIEFLLQLQGRKGLEANSSYLSELKNTLRVFLNEKGQRNFQNPELEQEFETWAQRYI